MKKFLLLFLFGFLCLPCVAQEDFDFMKLPQMNMDDMIKNIQKNPSYNEKMLVEMLFSIPVEYHQYIMPMVGSMRSISEKVRMMPGIVEWRRKLPTRLPPELSEYAKTHLKYLDPIYYPLLMPESWPSFAAQQEAEHNHESIPMVLDISDPIKMESVFPSSINPDDALFTMMQETDKGTPKIDNKNAITASDVASVINLLEKFKILGNGTQGEKRRNAMLYDFKDQNLLLDALVNPCESLVNRFEKIDTDGWLDLQLKKENMSKTDYVQKCDRIVKAFRVRTMSSEQAHEIVRLTREALKLPENSFYRRIFLTIAHMHQASLADVRSLKGFDDELKKTFMEKKMIMSTPFLLDF